MLKKVFKFSFIIVFFLIFLTQCELNERPEKIKPVKFHTPQNEGIWQGKSDEHMPVVTFSLNENNTIDVRVPLKPRKNPRHYIEVIVLMQGNKQIAVKKNSFSYYEARAKFKLPTFEKDIKTQNYWVFAKCNLHGMWKVPVRK